MPTKYKLSEDGKQIIPVNTQDSTHADMAPGARPETYAGKPMRNILGLTASELRNIKPWQLEITEFASKERGANDRLKPSTLLAYARSEGYTGPKEKATQFLAGMVHKGGKDASKWTQSSVAPAFQGGSLQGALLGSMKDQGLMDEYQSKFYNTNKGGFGGDWLPMVMAAGMVGAPALSLAGAGGAAAGAGALEGAVGAGALEGAAGAGALEGAAAGAGEFSLAGSGAGIGGANAGLGAGGVSGTGGLTLGEIAAGEAAAGTAGGALGSGGVWSGGLPPVGGAPAPTAPPMPPPTGLPPTAPVPPEVPVSPGIPTDVPGVPDTPVPDAPTPDLPGSGDTGIPQPPLDPTIPPTTPSVPSAGSLPDWLPDWAKQIPASVWGAGIQGVLGYLGADAKGDALKDIYNQQTAVGAPYRDLLLKSYQPGFDLFKQPGYGDAFNQMGEVAARSAGVKGNPGTTPSLQGDIMSSVWNQGFLPAQANYRGGLMQAGGMGLNTSAVAGMAGADFSNPWLTGAGTAAGGLFGDAQNKKPLQLTVGGNAWGN